MTPAPAAASICFMLGKRREGDPRGGRDRLEIQTAVRPDGAELHLSGELTLATAGRFLDELIEVEISVPRLLVLDLRRLRFVDSAALRELVAAHKRSQKEGRRLVIVTTDGPIERLLTITGLDRELETADQPPAVVTTKNAERKPR